MPIDFSGGGPLDGQSMIPPDEEQGMPAGDPGGGLAALFGGGGPAGPPPGPEQQGPAEGGDTDNPVSILQRMIDDAKTYLDVEQDEEDKATMTKVLSQLQSYLAKEQKEAHAALGVSPAQKFMAKRSAGLR